MGLFLAAWLTGEGIIVWRWVKAGAPPTPGALAAPSAVYLGLAVLAMYDPARATAATLAWGLDLAVLLKVVGKSPGQQTGWPPLCIPDGQFMPKKGAGVPCASASSSGGGANGSGVTGGIGGISTTLPPAVPGAPNIDPSQGGGTQDATGLFPTVNPGGLIT